MDSYEIIIPNNTPEKKFLYDCIVDLDDCEAQDFNYKQYDKLIIKIDPIYHDKLLDIIADIITTFYKFRVLNSFIQDSKFNSFDFFAFIGALLSVDKEKEISEVKKVAKNLKSIAPLSLFEFRLDALKASWQNLLELSKNLTSNLSSTEELYEIISYFVSSSSVCPKVTITDSQPIKLCVGGKILSPIPLTSDYDTNILLTAMREHPSHIIIKNQELLNENLLSTLRALGQ
ncbi:MAG: hypothetical protein IJ033_03225 [Clostridia bacterium]|nr:hypothetical protein [Clostridia bacterium]